MTLTTACQSIHAQEEILSQDQLSQDQLLYGDKSGQLNDQGFVRTYNIYTPKSYNPEHPMPLVLIFHGDNGSGRSISNVSGFNALAEKEGFIAAYPDAIDHRWSLSVNSSRKVDDLSFASALITHLQQTRNIDSRRIYAAGFSKGAILTQALACQMPEKIAGFASVAGSLPARLQKSCQSRPVSILTINGTNDQSVHFNGDNGTQPGALISIPGMVNFWRSHDQCTSPTTSKSIHDFHQGDRPRVETYRYNNCIDGSEILQLLVVDGGHMWPGGSTTDPSLAQFNSKIGLNATDKIWDFFQHHNRNNS